MGLMDKVKKILFDEDEVEIPVNSDELPERAPKKREKEGTSKVGFIDYHNEEVEEDIIKEVHVPKDDEILKPKKEFKFPIEDDFGEELPTRSRVHSEVSEPTKEIPTIEPRREVREKARELNRDLLRETKVERKEKKQENIPKDYKALAQSQLEETGKKPFKVTPVISPVYGIVDKEYQNENPIRREETISKPHIDSDKPRLFGPVSYNDQPLPSAKRKKERQMEKESLKEDLVELNTTISELIDDSIQPHDIHTEEINNTYESAEPIITESVEEPRKKIQELETSGIESEYIGNNTIEDAFESTKELESIEEQDAAKLQEEVHDITPNYEEYDLINKEEEENLDNTIETDLFNLIDSMYKSDENEEEER